MKTFVVAAEDVGRVDKILAKHYPDAGRKQLAELFEAGVVRVNKKKARKGDFVSPGDEISLEREPVSGEALRPVADPSVVLDILFESPTVIVMAKPAGIPSQPLRAGELGTMANGIVARYPECATIGNDPRDGGLVHRLDIGTSGVLVAARTPDAYKAIRDAFARGDVHKEYLAITQDTPVSREMDAPLAQRGDHVVVDHTDGLTASTQFQPLASSGTHTLVRCIASTGRMHQIRAHLAFANSPIAGDVLYKGAPVEGFDGFFLHAEKMTVPVDGAAKQFVAPLPQRFRDAAASLGLDLP
ncbi:MAG: RluA family pseudouridine synthase [Kofleriaceae bacterium]